MHTFIQHTEQKGHQPFLLKKTKSFIGCHKRPAEQRTVQGSQRGVWVSPFVSAGSRPTAPFVFLFRVCLLSVESGVHEVALA